MLRAAACRRIAVQENNRGSTPAGADVNLGTIGCDPFGSEAARKRRDLRERGCVEKQKPGKCQTNVLRVHHPCSGGAELC